MQMSSSQLSGPSYRYEPYDSASAVINNWIGCVYQVTNENIRKPFMQTIDPNNPLNLEK